MRGRLTKPRGIANKECPDVVALDAGRRSSQIPLGSLASAPGEAFASKNVMSSPRAQSPGPHRLDLRWLGVKGALSGVPT